MNKLTLTLRLDSKPWHSLQTEALCDIKDQQLSASMMGAALRALADEIDPRGNSAQVPF